MKYFYYDIETGFEVCETEQEAIDIANNMIDEARHEATHDGEWPEWVNTICYGEIKGLSDADLQEDNESYEFKIKALTY